MFTLVTVGHLYPRFSRATVAKCKANMRRHITRVWVGLPKFVTVKNSTEMSTLPS